MINIVLAGLGVGFSICFVYSLFTNKASGEASVALAFCALGSIAALLCR